MMLMYNESPYRYIVGLVLLLPAFAVTDMSNLLLIAPACALSLAILWYIPLKVVVVAPKDIDDALYELDPVNKEVKLIVYHKSVQAYAKEMKDKVESSLSK